MKGENVKSQCKKQHTGKVCYDVPLARRGTTGKAITKYPICTMQNAKCRIENAECKIEGDFFNGLLLPHARLNKFIMLCLRVGEGGS